MARMSFRRAWPATPGGRLSARLQRLEGTPIIKPDEQAEVDIQVRSMRVVKTH
jgi:hypothetical protein